MRLEGIHHITCITADAPANVEFYAGTLGLRLVKKTVNQDDPTVYHLFYADERGSAGSDITFFEYPGARRGRPGAGMVHRIVWRVGSEEALDFWQNRVPGSQRGAGSLRFSDPEGLEHELVVANVPDEPRIADHPEIQREMALQGFHGVRAYGGRIERSAALIEDVLGGKRVAENTWELRGDRRGGTIQFDAPPAERGIPGAGTVHHVAWGTSASEHPKWVDELANHGVHSTPVVDRHFFKSIYFREPGGVLYEIADDGPGFGNDDALGREILLPPWYESHRTRIESMLTPIPDPRAGWARK